MAKKVPFTVTCLNGDGSRLLMLPGKRIVCERCEGEGKHTNPNIDGNGITAEEMDADPEFRENYLAGVYDVPCEECRGERVVSTLDLDRLPKALRKRVEQQIQAEAEHRSEQRHQLRCLEMGIHY